MKQLLNLLPAVLVALALGSCGSSSPTAASSVQPVAPNIDAVVFAFSENFSSFTKAGATSQVTVIAVMSNGTTRDVTSTCTNWQSDNTGVLSVNGSGMMTALSATGSAHVTTTYQGVVGSGLVTLNPAPPPTTPPVSSPTPGPGGPITPSSCNPALVPASVDCLNNQPPGPPTALCVDGAFSCSQTASGTCSSHGGVACWVCPGPLCHN